MEQGSGDGRSRGVAQFDGECIVSLPLGFVHCLSFDDDEPARRRAVKLAWFEAEMARRRAGPQAQAS